MLSGSRLRFSNGNRVLDGLYRRQRLQLGRHLHLALPSSCTLSTIDLFSRLFDINQQVRRDLEPSASRFDFSLLSTRRLGQWRRHKPQPRNKRCRRHRPSLLLSTTRSTNHQLASAHTFSFKRRGRQAASDRHHTARSTDTLVDTCNIAHIDATSSSYRSRPLEHSQRGF